MGLKEMGDGSACSCGSEACGGGNHAETRRDEPSDETIEDEDDLEMVLMCPTCDEPFVPEYPRSCAWCGHEFADGFEVGPIQPMPEEIGSRVTAIVLGLDVLVILVVAYFTYIL